MVLVATIALESPLTCGSVKTIFKMTTISTLTYVNIRSKVVSVRNEFKLLAFALMLLFTACGRCVECVYDAGGSETICESEFDSPALYDLAIDNAEAGGATCTSTGGL